MIDVHFKNIRDVIINELTAANDNIKIAVCWFTNKELFDLICTKLDEQVKVSLIILNDKINNSNNGLDFQKFINLGGSFYFSDLENPMHNKFCIIDDNSVINGSYNWTNYAELKNYENITIIKNQVVVNDFIAEFERIAKECKSVLNINDDANTESIQETIVEHVKLALDSELIVENKEETTETRYLISSLGEKVYNDSFFKFISKGSIIPISKQHTLTTIYDNQTECDTDVRYGENSTGSLNTYIGNFGVNDIPPLPKGVAGLNTSFSIDKNGILTVTVRIRETGKTIKNRYDINYLLKVLPKVTI